MFSTPITVIKHTQAEINYSFRCCCFILNSLNTEAFLVLLPVHSRWKILIAE
jgi:hypothetical protein